MFKNWSKLCMVWYYSFYKYIMPSFSVYFCSQVSVIHYQGLMWTHLLFFRRPVPGSCATWPQPSFATRAPGGTWWRTWSRSSRRSPTPTRTPSQVSLRTSTSILISMGLNKSYVTVKLFWSTTFSWLLVWTTSLRIPGMSEHVVQRCFLDAIAPPDWGYRSQSVWLKLCSVNNHF